MLSREDVVEIVALHKRGWSVSAIARHTGRDRKTVRAWLAGERDREARRAAGPLEPFCAYVEQRLGDDPHLDATVLLRELRPLGFERSYQTLTRELRRLELRPVCEVCKRGGHRVTIELEHPPGEELQLDWLELPQTPWGQPASVLVGALSHSGRIRAVVSDGEEFARLVAALDGVLRRLGGTARCWRTDRMSTIVEPGSGRLRPEAAELA
jgi:transposase